MLSPDKLHHFPEIPLHGFPWSVRHLLTYSAICNALTPPFKYAVEFRRVFLITWPIFIRTSGLFFCHSLLLFISLLNSLSPSVKLSYFHSPQYGDRFLCLLFVGIAISNGYIKLFRFCLFKPSYAFANAYYHVLTSQIINWCPNSTTSLIFVFIFVCLIIIHFKPSIVQYLNLWKFEYNSFKGY